MFLFKGVISLCLLVAAVSSNYAPKYHKKEVNLHKLCSWNVVQYEKSHDLLRDDSWDSCKLDSGRAYIPENNIPVGFGLSQCRRVFVSQPRSRTGVYSNLGYFRLDDIGHDEVCPPLTPFPPRTNVTLNADCCTDRNVVNVHKFSIDSHNRLWALDRQALDLNDKPWNLASPRLLVFDLKTDSLVREAVLPAELYGDGEYQLGLETVIVNVDQKDPNNAYAYVLDSYFGCIVVYSYAQNKFWRVCSPEFGSDAKYSKFTLKTCKHKDVTYYSERLITDCTRDFKNQQLVCHSEAQLDEYTVPFAELNSEAVARCSPDSLNVKFLGQKNRNGQSNTHTMNKEKQVVWTLQEQNYGVACWNRENKLHPDAVELVVSDHRRLPYVTDVELTSVDLSHFLDYRCHVHPYNYVVVLSNNYRSIVEHGLDHKDENFGLYFFVEEEALEAYPQCLYKEYPRHQPKPHYSAPPKHYNYEPKPVYNTHPERYHERYPESHHRYGTAYRYKKSSDDDEEEEEDDE